MDKIIYVKIKMIQPVLWIIHFKYKYLVNNMDNYQLMLLNTTNLRI
mgnify:CR=1